MVMSDSSPVLAQVGGGRAGVSDHPDREGDVKVFFVKSVSVSVQD
jgi:hypothetical protein